MENLSMKYYAEIVDLLATQTSQLSQTIDKVYTKYGKSVKGTIC
jgi:hypothetical protein